MNDLEYVLHEGSRRFGINPSEVTPLNYSDFYSMNLSSRPVFQYRDGGQDCVLKFAEVERDRLPAAEEIVEFVDYLARCGVRVCRPRPSVQGRLAEPIEIDGKFVMATKTVKVPGEHLYGVSDRVNDALFREWGRTAGQLHAAARDYTGGQHIEDWRHEIDNLAPLVEAEDVRACWLEVGNALQGLPQPPDAYGLVHNDLHPENFLLDRGGITVLDFDVCHRHWFVLDIAMAVYVVAMGLIRSPDEQNQGEAFTRHCFETFMAGYEAHYHLDSFWIHQMPLFLRHRFILPYMLYEKGMIERNDPNRDGWRHAIVGDYQPVRPEVWQEY